MIKPKLRFKQRLEEAIAVSASRKVAELVSKYLTRVTKFKVFAMPGSEQYRNSNDHGFGVRFLMTPGAMSVRFNWKTVSVDSASLQSVDIWTAPGKGVHIKFDTNVSLVKTLPYIAEVLNNLKKIRPGTKFTHLNEETMDDSGRIPLFESADATEIFDSVVSIITSPNFKKGRVWSIWKSPGMKIFDAIADEFPDLLTKSGTSYSWGGSSSGAEIAAKRDKILDSVEAIRGSISRVSKKEQIEPSSIEKEIENNRERLTFEAQLTDLENLIKMTVSGASNALFVAGRGGCLDENTAVNIKNEDSNTIKDIKNLALNHFGLNELEPNKFYDILNLGIEIESPDGYVPVASIVRKVLCPATVTLKNSAVINCADTHYLTTKVGSIKVSALDITKDLIKTRDGFVGIESISINEDFKADFYDLEVLSDSHLFYTADGICHHNTGKTHTVEATLSNMGLSDGNGYFKNTGSASAAGLYSILFLHRDGILLFDDSDDALKDQTSRNLFKAATDTKKVRKLSWTKGGFNVVDPDDYEDPQDIIDENKIPRFFEFTGKIIFISNLKIDKLDPDGALRTRAFMIDIDPTDVEVYDFMEKIVDDVPLEDGLSLSSKDRKLVIEILRSSKSKQSANIRKMVRGINMYAGSQKAGVSVSRSELQRLVEFYA
jgi:hypothetical protein